MPRKARLRIAGMPLHVIQRGNNKQLTFFSDGDRQLYLGLLAELLQQHRCYLHAYVLMTNHVHLLVTSERLDGISMLMKDLGQRYVQHVNRTRKRSGSLWEGRFRSSIVDTDSYLFTCYRYVELNPVRAGVVRHPLEYAWSSYRTNTAGEPSLVVTPHENFIALGDNDSSRRCAYESMFQTNLSEAMLQQIRDAANGGFALGSEAFVERLGKSLGKRPCRGAPGRPRK
jgi:putative transposase